MAQTKKPLSSRMFRLVAGLVFCWMLLLNCLTPYLADDYTFAYAFDTGERLHSLPQLISSLVFHYHEWSGRVIVKFFAQGFTMFPKLLFNVCNAGMFMALGLVLYKLAVGRRSQKEDWLALALIYAALWEISPVFGQTNLWMCGACNYLWATVGCCAFLLPWRYYLQQPFAIALDTVRGLGMAVTPENLLTPRKSVTAILGVADHPVTGARAGCGHCLLREKCEYRKRGTTCEN